MPKKSQLSVLASFRHLSPPRSFLSYARQYWLPILIIMAACFICVATILLCGGKKFKSLIDVHYCSVPSFMILGISTLTLILLSVYVVYRYPNLLIEGGETTPGD